jgi:hypothetical protein
MLGDTLGLSSGKPECKVVPIPIDLNFCFGLKKILIEPWVTR